VAAGAFSGAVLGAAVASPWNTGEGALIGAAAGAMVGAVAESAAADEARRVEEAQLSQQAAATERYGQKADGYRRALTACLEARGYAVH
jgi:outer membrane lipoprotein SlyB